MSYLDMKKHPVDVWILRGNELVNHFVESVHTHEFPAQDDIANARKELETNLKLTAYAHQEGITLIAHGEAIGWPLYVQSDKQPKTKRYLLVRAEAGILSPDSWFASYDTYDEAKAEMNRQIATCMLNDVYVNIDIDGNGEPDIYVETTQEGTFSLCNEGGHGFYDACAGPEWQIFDMLDKTPCMPSLPYDFEDQGKNADGTITHESVTGDIYVTLDETPRTARTKPYAKGIATYNHRTFTAEGTYPSSVMGKLTRQMADAGIKTR